jgi:hypothetical protein
MLELSVDAHIRRRGTVRDSAKSHNLTGAVTAYGKALGILTALQQREEFHRLTGQLDVPVSVGVVS